MAEASSTTSFILCSLAPFRAQLLGKADSRFDVSPCPLLDALNTASQRRNAQFAVHDAQIQHIANVHPQRLAHGSRNNKPALCTHARPSPKFRNSRESRKFRMFQNFHLSHPSPLVTQIYDSGTN